MFISAEFDDRVSIPSMSEELSDVFQVVRAAIGTQIECVTGKHLRRDITGMKIILDIDSHLSRERPFSITLTKAESLLARCEGVSIISRPALSGPDMEAICGDLTPMTCLDYPAQFPFSILLAPRDSRLIEMPPVLECDDCEMCVMTRGSPRGFEQRGATARIRSRSHKIARNVARSTRRQKKANSGISLCHFLILLRRIGTNPEANGRRCHSIGRYDRRRQLRRSLALVWMSRET
jgi:hypothetical protein